jgi:hypothetical protein
MYNLHGAFFVQEKSIVLADLFSLNFVLELVNSYLSFV